MAIETDVWSRYVDEMKGTLRSMARHIPPETAKLPKQLSEEIASLRWALERLDDRFDTIQELIRRAAMMSDTEEDCEACQ